MALKRFRTSGKFVIAHSQSFYSGGLGDYVVAAASDEIWMQPVSTFFSAGTSTTSLFLEGAFDKVEATPQFVQRYEYKNAANMFTQTDFTPAHREATLRLLQSWYDTSVDEVAADRSLSRDALVSVLDASPVTVEEVREKGLITHIGYDDDARDAAEAKAGEDAEFTDFDRYAQAARGQGAGSGAPTIAFVHAAGEILEGDNDNPLSDSVNSIYGDVFAKAIREATDDNSVQAILLRVDSPGGSAIASDQILQAVKKARAAGKPVVVSMGSVAASGRLLHRAWGRSYSRSSRNHHRFHRRAVGEVRGGADHGLGRCDGSRIGRRKECAVPFRDHAVDRSTIGQGE